MLSRIYRSFFIGERSGEYWDIWGFLVLDRIGFSVRLRGMFRCRIC